VTVDQRLSRRFRRVGLPLGLAGLLESAGWLVMGLLIARAGVAATATHGVLAQLLALGLALSQGVAAAGTVGVARAIGRRDRNRAGSSARLVLAAQSLLGLGLALAVLASGRTWVRLFTDEVAVSAATGSLLPLLAGMMLVEGLLLVLYGIVEGSGRTRVLLHATVIFDVGFVTLALLRLGPGAGLGSLYGAWLLKCMLKAGFLLAWLERGRWRALLELFAPGERQVLDVALRPWAIEDDRRRGGAVELSWALPAPDT
jgi:MATE family multidrug resistance protein